MNVALGMDLLETSHSHHTLELSWCLCCNPFTSKSFLIEVKEFFLSSMHCIPWLSLLDSYLHCCPWISFGCVSNEQEFQAMSRKKLKHASLTLCNKAKPTMQTQQHSWRRHLLLHIGIVDWRNCFLGYYRARNLKNSRLTSARDRFRNWGEGLKMISWAFLRHSFSWYSSLMLAKVPNKSM